MWRQPKTVWSVAFACVIAFMGIGLVDPILKPIADDLGATASQVSLLFTSYMAVMGVAMLVTGWVSSRARRQAHPAARAGHHHRRRRARRCAGLDRRDRRLPRRVGAGQRAVHRHRPGHHRQRGAWLGRPGDHPLRGGAGRRHRHRSAARRLAGRALVALAVLGRLGAHGGGLRGDRHHAPGDPADRPAQQPRRTVPGAVAPRPAHRRPHRPALQLRLLHAAGLHPVPARPGRSRGGTGLLRLGRPAGAHLGAWWPRACSGGSARCPRWSAPCSASPPSSQRWRSAPSTSRSWSSA